MFDAAGATLDASRLTPRQRIEAILLWSALPGASRHHWGTDLDLVDRRAGGAGYRGQTDARGVCARRSRLRTLNLWLTEHAPRFGFFRPFQGVRSGVQPEPWHFSFAPIAEQARRRLTPQVLRSALGGAALLGKEAVLEQSRGTARALRRGASTCLSRRKAAYGAE